MSSTSSSSSNSIFDSPVRLGKRRASQRRASPSTSATESPIRPARGRGRGRGKGKGPASRKDKKSVREADPNRDEVALSVIQTRKDRFREDMKTMPREQLEKIILGVLDENPGLILDFHKPVARGEGGYHPPEGAESPDWCVCGKCREMPTQAERICCEREPRHCFSLLPDFTVLVLDPAVLRLARLQRRDILLLDDADEEDPHKANRHAAYRQYILWAHGRLGVGNRRVIPSCCVWAIRDKYPNPFQIYVGFVPARLV
ncbi:uncharacterized protein LOC127832518 [Dreissena polymorpha]|uniref:uncharacterized protein LOC127832518 n=1 Tax=Dreissena polymorpha TaxID=45954 RepID=UPI00226534A0|nr:uncharacterized protein LOC127832518 [Dreissena polymorpha]